MTRDWPLIMMGGLDICRPRGLDSVSTSPTRYVLMTQRRVLNKSPTLWTRAWTCGKQANIACHFCRLGFVLAQVGQSCYKLVDLDYSYEVTSVTIFKSKSNGVEM